MPHMIPKHRLDYTRRIKYNDRVPSGVDAAAAPWPILQTSVIRVYMNELESIHESITDRIKREQIALLNDNKWFASLSNVNTGALRSELEIRHCKKGEIIFEVGDESTHFYLLFAGEVRTDSSFNVEHITKWPTNINVTEWDFKTRKIFRSLQVLKAPSLFGHVSILVKSPRIIRATCATDCTLLVGDKQLLYSYLDEDVIKKMMTGIEQQSNPYDIGETYLSHKLDREEHLQDFRSAVKVNAPTAG